MQNGGTCHEMAALIRNFLTDREKLNRPAIHLIWSFGKYTEPPDFKKNPNVVYATNISKITNFSKRLKDRTQENITVNSFNVNNYYKRFKVLRETMCVWKMQNIQLDFVLHCFKSDDELRNEFRWNGTVTGRFAHFPIRPESFRPESFRPRVVSPSITWVVSPSYPESFRPLFGESFRPLSKFIFYWGYCDKFTVFVSFNEDSGYISLKNDMSFINWSKWYM